MAHISLQQHGVCVSAHEGDPVFTKSTLFNRNDPPPVHEKVTPSSPGPRTATANGPSPMRTTSPQRETLAPVRVDESARPVSASPPATSPTGKHEEKDKEISGIDSGTGGMGARLIVGPEVKLKGAEILDCDTLVVEGRVEATMDSRVIRIAEHGSFIGKVSIDIAEIHGSFEGDLTARSQLIIHATGRVKGTIRYGKLVADEGCELCGDINVLPASDAAASKAMAHAEPIVTLNAAAG